mmetsp:Transcript_46255/g.100561  ORF Transcript_46255/g.100561 Transcript_46255/m.100561 type:complete len:265 (+) Transcript_46255:59-853(+)|eukprot:CAMPEP_0170606324 /NCGR_PEP_ID=MMETSP0224-20130122/20452_1 /TAXON_ID=285029 /ORGANISM="Togula jolla, Strain CCCM 725" /LENGTH=264 /DNA_ID=CAMNT_0010931399 /DNA_START=57 /DNA_END=851 /DNA_ORIENTATION=-
MTDEASQRRREGLMRHLKEIEAELSSLAGEIDVQKESAPVAMDASSAPVAEPAARPIVDVIVGTSEHAHLVKAIVDMVNRSYDYSRLSEGEVLGRLRMGDAGIRANRVLHLAMLDGKPVGCMSSTFQPPWTEEGCGHWGLLVVAVEMQGKGVASQLVAAAERRLAGVCHEIQIEYEYTPGDEYSDRLKSWYEGSCGFRCVSGNRRCAGAQFRKCRKETPAELLKVGRYDRLKEIRDLLTSQLNKDSDDTELNEDSESSESSMDE